MPEDPEIATDRVTLDLYEMRMWGQVGLDRHKIVVDRRPDWNFGAGQTELTPAQRYAIGTCGEFALSIMLNQCCRPYIGRANMHDVGGAIECRTVQASKLQRLNLEERDREKAGSPFVLVRWTPPNVFEARGWQWGDWIFTYCDRYTEGARCWWCDRFLPMDDLRRWIYARPIRSDTFRNRDPGAVQR